MLYKHIKGQLLQQCCYRRDYNSSGAKNDFVQLQLVDHRALVFLSTFMTHDGCYCITTSPLWLKLTYRMSYTQIPSLMSGEFLVNIIVYTIIAFFHHYRILHHFHPPFHS